MIILIVLSIFALLGIVLYLYFKNDSYISKSKSSKPYIDNKKEIRGQQAEDIAHRFLYSLLKEDEYLLTNLLVPTNNCETEIDAVLITHRGIFCIEVKSWAGTISGDRYDEYWTQEYKGYKRYTKQQRNPYKQNEKHVDILERKLLNQYDIYNVVLFVEVYGQIQVNSRYAYNLLEFKNFYYSKQIDDYSIDLEEIYDSLNKYTATIKQLREFKNKQDNRYKDN